jgi:hypothetical protein
MILPFTNGAEWEYQKLVTEKSEVWYGYMTVENGTLCHSSQLKQEEKVELRLSTFDAEFLGSASDRYGIYYDADTKKRTRVRRMFPLEMEFRSRMEEVWDILSGGNESSQLHQAYLLLRQKEADWGWDTDDGTQDQKQQWQEFQMSVLRGLEWRKDDKPKPPTEEQWRQLRDGVEKQVLLPALEWNLKALMATREERRKKRDEVKQP